MHGATDVLLLLLLLLLDDSECSISKSQTAITTCLTTRVQLEDHFIRTSNCACFFLSPPVVTACDTISCPIAQSSPVSISVLSEHRGSRQCGHLHYRMPIGKKLAKILTQSRLCVDVKAQRGRLEAGHPSSFSPQGLSSPMLIVIFLSRHCSLLCSPSFLIILSAIYQTMKSQRNKKNLNLSFLCIMAYVEFFEKKRKCFVCSLSFRAVKKELVVCRIYPNY